MAHDPLQSMIVVSKPSTSSLVSAYGLAKVRKISICYIAISFILI
jgi:hypothetical protein